MIYFPPSLRPPNTTAILKSVLLFLSVTGAELAQPPSPPGYSAQALDCTGYRQRVRSDVRVQSGGHQRRQNSGREAIVVLRAESLGDSLEVEGWFDSLVVWREEDGQRFFPETDGVIGGRYRGRLSRDGVFHPTDRPFIPDEVAEVVELADALSDLLPRLPSEALRVGQTWSNSAELQVTRLADSSGIGRYRLTARRERQEDQVVGESLQLAVGQVESEQGVFSWHPERGLLRWTRDITTEATIPAGGPIARPIRTKVEQRVELERVANAAGVSSLGQACSAKRAP